METNDYIAVGAAVISLLSVAFSFYSGRQAKRQADAVLGDVPPSFGVYQIARTEYTSQESLSIEIINHNRRALLIEEITLEYPSTVTLFADAADTRTVIGNIIDGMKTGTRTKQLEIPHRIRGHGINSAPSILLLPFKCHWLDSENREPVAFCFRLGYRLDGDKESLDAFGCVRVIPSKLD